MNTATKIALSKAAEKSLAKGEKLSPGIYPIDETLTVHISGTISKAADVDYTPTADVPLKMALALTLQLSGVTRERSKAILVEAMTVALNAKEQAENGIAEYLADIDSALAHVESITANLPKKTRTGATVAKVSLEVVEIDHQVAA